MTNVLRIDTSRRDVAEVALDRNGDIVFLKGKSKKWKAQQVLFLIDELLQKQKVKVEQLDRIDVNIGPGSFTGLRVGVAVANSIGWALDVPINDAGYGKIATPIYST